MVKSNEPTPPPYLPEVATAAASTPPGTVAKVYVLHDPARPLMAGRRQCTCKPLVAAQTSFVLWFRKKRGYAWEALVAAATERDQSQREAWGRLVRAASRPGTVTPIRGSFRRE